MSLHVGILDWGIGGLDLTRRLCRHPELSLRYLSDAGSTPYGRLSRPQLARRVRHALGLLASAGASELIIACNAASSVVADLGLELPVHDVIGPALRATLAHGSCEVAVIGGQRTIRSGVYRAPLSARGVRVRQRIAQPLSALVERGELRGTRLDAAVERIGRPLAGSELLIVGCTHYMAVADALRAVIRPCVLVDPAEETYRQLRSQWSLGAPAADASRVVALTTGDPAAMVSAGRLAFGVELANVERVALC